MNWIRKKWRKLRDGDSFSAKREWVWNEGLPSLGILLICIAILGYYGIDVFNEKTTVSAEVEITSTPDANGPQ